MNAHLNTQSNMKIRAENNRSHQVKSELLQSSIKAGCVDLSTIASVVKRHSGTLIPLVKPKSYHLRVCGQDGTVYAGNAEQLEAWKDFYLPERMEMEVIGAIDDFPCEAFALQLVLLLCEDGNIYAYEDEVLHLVATSLKELFEAGINFPASQSFKLGECFEDYTQEEYDEMMKSTEVQEVIDAHNEFRESLEVELLKSLMELNKSQIKTGTVLAPDVKFEEGTTQILTSTTETRDCKHVVVRKSMPVVCWSPSIQKQWAACCF